MDKIQSCQQCKRLHDNFRNLTNFYPNYHNRPVSGIGNKSSKICLIGLAPGLHGANKTGIPFMGDFSGDILRTALTKNFLSTSNYKKNFNPIYITNTVKCYPPFNKPTSYELNECINHLINEVSILKKLKVIIALGFIAHNAVLDMFSLQKSKYKFKHKKKIWLDKKIILLDSYHCSKLNINTKRLTIKQFVSIIAIAKELAYGNK